MTDLAEFYQQKVKDFLKTVVCFDDRAYDDAPKGADVVKVALKTSDGFSEDDDDGNHPVVLDEIIDVQKDLKDGFAKAITDAFSDMGILCAVIKPDTNGEQAQLQIRKLAQTADVAIVDWHLVNQEGQKDTSIMREAIIKIIKDDEERGGCLRLIVIYSDGNGPDIINELSALLKARGHIGFKCSPAELELQNAHSLIVFFQKSGPSVPTAPEVDYKDLPGRVVDSFTKLTSGLLPAAALSAISVIRQQSHHLLATFPATLDGAYLTHRCLIPDPNDAEQFLLDLFEGEIGALLAHSRMNDAVDGTRCKAWVEKNCRFDAAQKSRLKKSLTKYSKAKIDGFKALFNEQKLSKETVSEKVLELLYMASPEDMKRAKENFSVLSSLDTHRRRITASERKNPRLRLGSVVRETWSDRYLLCIQPLCDSTRIGRNHEIIFPFLILDSPPEPKDLDLCVPDEENGVVWLSISPKPQRLISYRFLGKSTSEAYVEAVELGVRKEYVFRTSDDKCLDWMADLKIGKAQRIVSQLASRIHTLGIDEFEWLRLHSAAERKV